MKTVLFSALIGLLCLEGAAAWGQGNRNVGSAGPGVSRNNRGFREPLQRPTGPAPGVNRVNSAPEREGRVVPAPPHPQYLTKAPAKVNHRIPNEHNFDLDEGGFFEPQVVLEPESFSGAVISGMDFSPSGQYLAVAGDVVRIWDIHASPKQMVHTLRGQREFGGVGSCTDVAYSPDGKYLLVSVNGYNASLRVYDTEDFSEIKEVYGGHDGHIVQIAFSPDGKYLATAGADNYIHVWNWAQRVKEQSYRLTKPVVHLSFPCGHPNLLALTDDGDLFYWSLETGEMADEGHRKPVYELYTNRPPVRAGKAHAHAAILGIPGRISVLGVYDQTRTNRFTCSVWGKDANKPLAEHAHPYFVTACAVEPAARIVASADALGQIHLWSMDTGTEIDRFKSQGMGVFSVAFDDASRLGFGRTPYKVGQGWNYNHYGVLNEVIDLSNGTVSPQPPTTPVTVMRSGARGLKLGNDVSVQTNNSDNSLAIPFGRSSAYRPLSGRFLTGNQLGFSDAVVVGFSNGVLCAYDPTNLLTKRTFLGHHDRVWGISQSPDGRLLATCSGDNTIRIWSLQAGRRLGNLAAYVEDDGTIYHVVRGTPSATVLRVGDTLLEIDKKPFSKLAEQFAAGGEWPYKPGEIVSVKFRRGGNVKVEFIELSDVGDIVEPLLNILVSPDGNDWIAWTQPGYYTSSSRGDRLIGWQVNQGRTKAARFYYADQFRDKFYRPDVVSMALETGDVRQAIQLANAEYANPPAPVDIRTDIQSISPPTVKLLQPFSGQAIASAEVTVKAEIRTSNAAPVQEVTVLVNGRTYSERNIVLEPSPTADGGTIFEKTVRLSAGSNRIAVHAKTSVATGRSEEIWVECRQPESTPRLFAVAVGVSEYKDEKLNLLYAAKDASECIEAMEQQKARGQFTVVHPKLLINHEATRTAVEKAITWLVKETTADDLVVFFFSAHGMLDKNRNYYLATHEADSRDPRSTCLHASQLQLMAKDIPCRSLLFIDTCHAGGALGNQHIVFDPYMSWSSDESGAVVFAAARAGSLGFEADGNGILTKALLDTLNDPDSDKDNPKDHQLSISELVQNLDRRVRELSNGKQIPVTQTPRALTDEQLFRLPASSAVGARFESPSLIVSDRQEIHLHQANSER